MDKYKEVKNVIHNEIGVTKEEIINVFSHIAQQEITKVIKENECFIKDCIKDIIKEEMMKALKDHKYPKVSGNIWDYGRGDGKVEFNDFISGVIKEEIVRRLENQFTINVDIDKK